MPFFNELEFVIKLIYKINIISDYEFMQMIIMYL